MAHVLAQLFAVLLLIALVTLANERRREIGEAVEALARELRDATRHFRLYSAETTRGREAEFIRDRLPKHLSTSVLIAFFVLCSVAIWWLTR
jgi:Sec-independent protein translocase protein TatA